MPRSEAKSLSRTESSCVRRAEAPGELLHIDIKKQGRFEYVDHRITGDRRRRSRHVGWECVFVAVGDHTRIAFTQIHLNERKESAVASLKAALA